MCGIGCAKCLLILINVTFFLVGGVLLTLGALAQFNDVILQRILDGIPDDVMDDITSVFDLNDFLQQAAIALMAAGGCIFVIGFMGCCGAMKQNSCLLSGYCLVVGLLLAAEIVGPIVIYVLRDQVGDAVKDGLQDEIQEYDNPEGGMYVKDGSVVFGGTPEKLAWDALQVLVECCGVNGPEDYNSTFSGGYNITDDGITPDKKAPNAKVPLSCCRFIKEFKNDSSAIEDEDELSKVANECIYGDLADQRHTKGCYDATMDLVTEYWYIALGVLLGVIFIEIVGLVSACVIMRSTGGKEGL